MHHWSIHILWLERQLSVPVKCNRQWINYAPGVFVEIFSTLRYAKVALRQNVCTNCVEMDWKMVSEVFDFKKKDWVETI